MKNEIFYVLAFDSTHEAIRAERLLKDALNINMIPTPREISVSCGLSIRFEEAILDAVLERIQAAKADPERVKLFKVNRRGASGEAERIKWG